jgi:rRNA maturation endonuclease Nob1
MNCKECNNEVQYEFNFCPYCGVRLKNGWILVSKINKDYRTKLGTRKF